MAILQKIMNLEIGKQASEEQRRLLVSPWVFIGQKLGPAPVQVCVLSKSTWITLRSIFFVIFSPRVFKVLTSLKFYRGKNEYIWE